MMLWLLQYLRDEPLALPTIILCCGFLVVWWCSKNPSRKSPRRPWDRR